MAAWDGLKRMFRRKRDVPEGLWMKCEGCGSLLYRKEVLDHLHVCPECNFHFTLPAMDRIQLLVDEGSFEEKWGDLAPTDPLGFVALVTYKEKLEEAQKLTGLRDAIVVGRARLAGHAIMIGVTDSRFIMGSMGSVVGEKVARTFEHAREAGLPVVFVSGSGGGARMYEGMLSLMQMAKTSAAIARYQQDGGFFISVLTHPTMAGVMASFASLGDLVVAEPRALIGFTGPRVIQETIKQELPEGFQTSEFLLDHGFLDRIVERRNLRSELATLLDYARHRAAPPTGAFVESGMAEGGGLALPEGT
jgi:acetyl-CoA carboxylase carboxyl transferase subunit beta